MKSAKITFSVDRASVTLESTGNGSYDLSVRGGLELDRITVLLLAMVRPLVHFTFLLVNEVEPAVRLRDASCVIPGDLSIHVVPNDGYGATLGLVNSRIEIKNQEDRVNKRHLARACGDLLQILAMIVNEKLSKNDTHPKATMEE